jgi:hypothetical protein
MRSSSEGRSENFFFIFAFIFCLKKGLATHFFIQKTLLFTYTLFIVTVLAANSMAGPRYYFCPV